MKPFCGSLPSRNRSTAAQMPAAVVIWIADNGSAALRSAKILRAKTSCIRAPLRRPLTVTNTSTTSCIVLGIDLRMMSFSVPWSLARPRSCSSSFIAAPWPG